MGRYALKRRSAITAEQFFPERKPWPRGVAQQPCFCADLAQDGRRCELHKEHGRRYGIVRVRGYAVEIERGAWIIDDGNQAYSVCSNEHFQSLYEEV